LKKLHGKSLQVSIKVIPYIAFDRARYSGEQAFLEKEQPSMQQGKRRN
jgi:hypothetical protein